MTASDNVVSLPVTKDDARRLLRSEVLFKRRQISLAEFDHAQRGDIICTSPTVNRSLALAHENNFLEMCLPLLWGDERQIHLERFGQLLRGAVETFKPLNRFELELVRGIVACQWRLDRLMLMQVNVFDNEAKKREVGKYGIPAATHTAMKFDQKLAEAQRALTEAISQYNLAVRISLLTSKERD